MDLIEEYANRHKITGPYVKYPDKAQLILRARPGKQVDYNWINVTIECRNEGARPNQYQMVVVGNPVVYATPDFSHFSYHHEKVLSDNRWDWDGYESGVVDWSKTIAANYQAVPSLDAMPMCWTMFAVTYDGWFANFMPTRLYDAMHASIMSDTHKDRIDAILLIEEWLKQRQDKVYGAWQTIRRQLESKGYADWLVNLVNAMHAG